jgi:hypothetical protein
MLARKRVDAAEQNKTDAKTKPAAKGQRPVKH